MLESSILRLCICSKTHTHSPATPHLFACKFLMFVYGFCRSLRFSSCLRLVFQTGKRYTVLLLLFRLLLKYVCIFCISHAYCLRVESSRCISTRFSSKLCRMRQLNNICQYVVCCLHLAVVYVCVALSAASKCKNFP